MYKRAKKRLEDIFKMLVEYAFYVVNFRVMRKYK